MSCTRFFTSIWYYSGVNSAVSTAHDSQHLSYSRPHCRQAALTSKWEKGTQLKKKSIRLSRRFRWSRKSQKSRIDFYILLVTRESSWDCFSAWQPTTLLQYIANAVVSRFVKQPEVFSTFTYIYVVGSALKDGQWSAMRVPLRLVKCTHTCRQLHILIAVNPQYTAAHNDVCHPRIDKNPLPRSWWP